MRKGTCMKSKMLLKSKSSRIGNCGVINLTRKIVGNNFRVQKSALCRQQFLEKFSSSARIHRRGVMYTTVIFYSEYIWIHWGIQKATLHSQVAVVVSWLEALIIAEIKAITRHVKKVAKAREKVASFRPNRKRRFLHPSSR